MIGGHPDIGILGAGAVARTLANVAARSGLRVVMWPGRHPKPKSGSTAKKAAGRKETPLAASVNVTRDIEEAGRDAPLLVLAVHASEVGETVRALGGLLTGDRIILHTARGLEFDGERILRMSEIIRAGSCVKKIGVLAGPFFSEEILAGQPAAMVIGSPFREVIEAARGAFASATFKLFSSDDLIGAELGCALNGVYAIAGGIGAGLGYGAVTQSFIITRGLAEMVGFGAVCGARAATFSGLSGLGELMANLTQERSAAFRLGHRLGRGERPSDSDLRAEACREAVETLESAAQFARKRRIPMPLLFGVRQILHGRRTAMAAAEILIAGDVGPESQFTLDRAATDLPIPATAPRGGPGKG